MGWETNDIFGLFSTPSLNFWYFLKITTILSLNKNNVGPILGSVEDHKNLILGWRNSDKWSGPRPNVC